MNRKYILSGNLPAISGRTLHTNQQSVAVQAGGAPDWKIEVSDWKYSILKFSIPNSGIGKLQSDGPCLNIEVADCNLSIPEVIFNIEHHSPEFV